MKSTRMFRWLREELAVRGGISGTAAEACLLVGLTTVGQNATNLSVDGAVKLLRSRLPRMLGRRGVVEPESLCHALVSELAEAARAEISSIAPEATFASLATVPPRAAL